MTERVRTGIPGLDEILGGGFIKGDLVLVTGVTGTGKTILATQFLYNSVTLYNEPAIFVSFEERPEDIKANALNFGWDFTKLEQSGKVTFVKYDPFHMEDIYGLIENHVRNIGAKRVVIDSITGLGLNIRDPADLRAAIFNLGRILKKLGCTTIFTSETAAENYNQLSRFGVEEYVTDDVIVLYYLPTETEFRRAVTVWKMRGSDHSRKIHPFVVSERGLTIYPHEESSLRLNLRG